MALIDVDELMKEVVGIGDLRRLTTKTLGEAIDRCRQIERVIPESWIRKEIQTTSQLSGECRYSEALYLMLMNWEEEQAPFDPRHGGRHL